MTSAAELLQRLRRLDIRLTLDGDRLGVDAPKGALTDELLEELRRRKDEVKAYLAVQPQPEAPAELVPVPRANRMPVSHTQQRLWFVKRMAPDSHQYNIVAVLRLKGTLDRGALQRALSDLVARHEGLRTFFESIDGKPVCALSAEADATLERLDLSALDPSAREAAAMSAVLAFSQRPFDIERAPLLHCLLVALTPEHHVFSFVMDHLVSDGISLGVFIHDLTNRYAHHVGAAAEALPELTLQYLDYADWERRAFAQGALDEHLDFWKGQLADLPESATLPADRSRPPVQTARGARATLQMPAELTEQIKRLARSEGATLFMALLSAFYATLHRLSGDVDLPVGTAVANRNRAEAGRVIGFFANNIVLRGNVAGDPTVRELLGRTRDLALQSYAHQDMPFDMLVETLGTSRSLDRSPLFQTMFVLQPLQFMHVDMAGLSCEIVELPVQTARFDLTIDVFDLAIGLRAYFEYNVDLFEPATMERVMQSYRRLLEGMVAHPDARISALPLHDAAAQAALVLDRNRTAQPYPRDATLHGLFEAQVARTPDALALICEPSRLDYRTLNARANQLAHHLRSLGVREDGLVGICMDRSPDMVVAMLGVLKAGGAYVPLDPAFPAERLAYMMQDAALDVVVTQALLADTLGGVGPRTVCLDRDAELLAGCSTENPAPWAQAESLAYVIYTSGSTGRPKGVMIEHRAVVNFLTSMQREPGIGPGDRFVAVTTLSFDIAGLELHGPLSVGGTVVLAPYATALDGIQLAALLDRTEATLLQATPATWRLLLESGWRGRPALKMLCGGEQLPRDVAARLLTLGGELWNMYGPTETTIWSTCWRVTDASRTVPIGAPIANTQVYVLEASGLPAPIGVAGELCIAGDGLARGYLHREELTAEKFQVLELPLVGRTRVYRTGDLVRWLPEGALEFVGRRDEQVKVRGFRIELGEIEAVLALHPGVRAAVAHVREDTPGDQRLVAYLVTDRGPADPEAVRTTLRTRLPAYMIPNQFVTLGALPLTPNGKVDRKALPAPERTVEVQAPDPDDAAMQPAQRQVAAIWRDILNVDRVGLNANFFDAGGHSLLLVRLQFALQRAFGREIPLVELFQHTTIAAQASRLGGTAAPNIALSRARRRAAQQLGVDNPD